MSASVGVAVLVEQGEEQIDVLRRIERAHCHAVALLPVANHVGEEPTAPPDATFEEPELQRRESDASRRP